MSGFDEDPFPGTASLAHDLDKKLLVLLRDGRNLVGILRSFDQFANLVLEHCIERIVVGNKYCDLPLGLYVVRGENVVLVGSIDPLLRELPSYMIKVTPSQIKEAKEDEKRAQEIMRVTRRHFGDFLDMDS